MVLFRPLIGFEICLTCRDWLLWKAWPHLVSAYEFWQNPFTAAGTDCDVFLRGFISLMPWRFDGRGVAAFGVTPVLDQWNTSSYYFQERVMKFGRRGNREWSSPVGVYTSL